MDTPPPCGRNGAERSEGGSGGLRATVGAETGLVQCGDVGAGVGLRSLPGVVIYSAYFGISMSNVFVSAVY